MADLPKIAHARRRRPLVAWCVAIGTTALAVWIAYLGFRVAHAVAIDFQVSSRWDNHTVAADQATIDTVILPAVEAYARREGRLPADLEALVVAGDLASIPDSQAGLWFYDPRPEGFTVGVGDPPHEYPCVYRVIELDGPGNADPDRWRVRDWYHDS